MTTTMQADAQYALIEDNAVVADTVGSLADWIAANEDGWHEADTAALVALAPGEETILGGGAAADAIVRRLR